MGTVEGNQCHCKVGRGMSWIWRRYNHQLFLFPEEEAELQQQRQPGGEGSLLLHRPRPGEWGGEPTHRIYPSVFYLMNYVPDCLYAKLNQESSRLRVTR